MDVQKEFNFAGDMVEAIWRLVNQTDIFEAVIGSGKVYTIKDWIIYCFSQIKKDWQGNVEIQKNFIPEYKVLISDPTIIKSLGWKPKVTFFELADMMLGSEIIS